MSKRYQVKDTFFKNAKRQGYRARSAYKLLAIQERFGVIQTGDSVIDLGAYPGSFTQVIAPIVGDMGLVISVDIQKISPFSEKWVHTYENDVYDQINISEIILEHSEKLDCVVSDMAPNTSGIIDRDQYLSLELNKQVFRIAFAFLKNGGNVVSKVFMGNDLKPFLEELKLSFKEVKCFKPPCCRERSKETFIIARGFIN